MAALVRWPAKTYSEPLPLPFHPRTREQRQLRDLYEQLYDQKCAAGDATDQISLLEAMPTWAREKLELYTREQEQERNPVMEYMKYESFRAKVPQRLSNGASFAAHFEELSKSRYASQPKKVIKLPLTADEFEQDPNQRHATS